jgi:uncharacterized protein (TIGR04442 family)
MIRDVHICGQVTDRYHYYTTVIGPHLNIRLLYDGQNEPGRTYDRFFGGGNELKVSEAGVSHSGNGGTFCSYMFGVDIPEKDLLRSDVRNRLVMHGAGYDEAHDRLNFSNATAGSESFGRIFNDGHAIANYYFFVLADIQGDLKTAQETLLRVGGKFLKRHDVNQGGRDGRDLAAALHEAMGIPQWTLFLVKIIDVHAEEYYRQYRDAYDAAREVTHERQRDFDDMARRFKLDPYQQERIHLDVIYEQEENKRIIDSYKEALTAHLENALPEQELMPKLNLLRAFSTRNKIPATIFDRLDSLLMHLNAPNKPAEPPFLVEARQILENLFVRRVGAELFVEDLIQLLHAKRHALEHRYVGFEAVLLDAAHASDEWARLGKAMQLRVQFEQIISYFDVFDETSMLVNSIAFIDDYELNEDRVLPLIDARRTFDELKPNLFEELFLSPLENNQYLNIYGRKRIDALKHSLCGADDSQATCQALLGAIRAINEKAHLHRLIDSMLRVAVGNIHEEPLDPVQREALRLDVESRLRSDYGIARSVDDNLFDSVLLGIEEEYFYANKLLPTIIATRDLKLRENFLLSSGLDRFRIEELEAAYLQDTLPRALSTAGT